MTSCLSSKSVKFKIYMSLIHLWSLNGNEACALTNTNGQQLTMFEGKILRKLYRPVHEAETVLGEE